MAERKAVNKWYPPDWDPKKGSLNTYWGESWRNGSATVNGRAGAAKGITIIRFETPWNMWCTTCNKMVGRGVRYNAEKNKVGKYYTTTLWSFTMRCHMCDGTIIIETDPKNDDYKIVQGAKKKQETWSEKSTETMQLMDTEEKKQLEADPMFRLEHGVQDEIKAKKRSVGLRGLLSIKSKDDYYERNADLRKSFRARKKEIAQQEKTDKALLMRSSLSMSEVVLLPEHAADKDAAKRKRFGRQSPSPPPITASTHAEQSPRLRSQVSDRKRRCVMQESIFGGGSGSRTGKGTSGRSMPKRRIDPTQFRLLSTKRHSDGGNALVALRSGRRAVSTQVAAESDGARQATCKDMSGDGRNDAGHQGPKSVVNSPTPLVAYGSDADSDHY
eukprot:m.1633511 g.1633511  ORF g.1633511 m.1633511 type:complete len:386 (+) comp25409_c0_seq7:383-1540(+)